MSVCVSVCVSVCLLRTFGSCDDTYSMLLYAGIVESLSMEAQSGSEQKILFGSHRRSAPHNPDRFFSFNSLYGLNIDTSDHVSRTRQGRALRFFQTVSLVRGRC